MAKREEKTGPLKILGYVVAVCGPLLLYVTLFFVLGLEGSGWIALGIIGCFLIPIGIVSMKVIGKYGYVIFAVGLALVVCSFFLLKDPTLGGILDMENVDTYFINLVLMIMPSIGYFMFRQGIRRWLKRKRGVKLDKVRKTITGAKNKWWYQSIHKSCNMGILYLTNVVYSLLLCTVLCLTIVFGMVKVIRPVIGILGACLCVLSAVVSVFYLVEHNLERYKKPVVFWRRDEYSYRPDTIFDFGITVGDLILAYCFIIVNF